MTSSESSVTTPENAFTIQGYGVATLSGISANLPCPFSLDDTLEVFSPTSSKVHIVRLKAIEYALLKTAEEQYGFVFDFDDISADEIPSGTVISRQLGVAIQQKQEANKTEVATPGKPSD